MPFVHRDPRGLFVVLDDGAYSHAADGHAASLQGKWVEITNALVDPDVILDNPQPPAVAGRLAQRRNAHERYVRFSEELQQNLVVPVRRLDAGTKPVDA